ncbi:MAG: fibronectin type III domain-containing protein, partial [Actinoplanes sp.]
MDAGDVIDCSTPGAYTITLPAGIETVDIMVVGGGGAGGIMTSGGNGAQLNEGAVPLPPNTAKLRVVVGAGGAKPYIAGGWEKPEGGKGSAIYALDAGGNLLDIVAIAGGGGGGGFNTNGGDAGLPAGDDSSGTLITGGGAAVGTVGGVGGVGEDQVGNPIVATSGDNYTPGSMTPALGGDSFLSSSTPPGGQGGGGYAGGGGGGVGAPQQGQYTSTGAGGGSSYLLGNANPSISHASNGNGGPGGDGLVQVYPNLPPEPGPPTGVTAVAGDTEATVSFTAPDYTGDSPIGTYTVTSIPDSITETCPASPCVIDNLVNGQAYTFTVKATNTNLDDSVQSAATLTPVIPGVRPSPPTITSVTPGAGTASVAFTAGNDGSSPIFRFTATSTPGNHTQNCAGSPCVVSGLTNGTPYTFTVTAENDTGVSAPSADSTAATPRTTPDAPTGVSAARGVAGGEAIVTFTAPVDNGGSAILDYQVTSSPGGVSETCNTSPCTVDGLQNGETYTFGVAARNVAGYGTPSTMSNAATVVGVPGAPAIYDTLAASGAVTVSFTDAADNGDPVTEYTVTSSPDNVTEVCAHSPCTVDGLTNGTPYTFTVKGKNAAGYGADSAPSAPAVTPIGVPGVPTAVTATRGAGLASVSFTAGSTGGMPIQDFTVTSSPGSLTNTCTGSPCAVSGLINGLAYTFTVTARNNFGSSNPSAPSNPVTPAAAPGPPVIQAVNEAAGQVTVEFVPSLFTGGVPATGYTVTSSPGNLTGTCSASPCTVTGLSNGTPYTFTVHATNVAGNSAESAPSAPAVVLASRPSQPTDVQATLNGRTALVSFTASNGNGAAVTGYTVTSAPDGLTGTCTTSPCTVTGLSYGTEYTFTVRATNRIGPSLSSVASNPLTPATAPGAPAGVTATIDANAATVSFTAPSGNGAAISGYTATAWPGGRTGTCAASPCTVTGLGYGIEYTFTVRATNWAGDSVESAPSAPVTLLGAPARPANVAATAGNRQAVVSFGASADNGSPVTGYTVTSTPGGATATCPASPCTVTGLTNGVAYMFTVRATNALGESPVSAASASVTPSGRPGAPSGLSATAGPGWAEVSFAPVAGATSYTVTTFPGAKRATCPGSPCRVTGLTNGVTYSLTVRATADGADSVESAAVKATPRAVVTPAPSAPGRPVAVRGTSSVVVTWTAPASGVATGYTVTADPGPATCTTTALSCTLGAEAGTAYTYTVVANSASGASAPSAASNAVTPESPVAPATVPATTVPLTTDQGDVDNVPAGTTVVIVGNGYAPHSTVTLTAYSTPVPLGTVVTDADGAFRVEVTMPAKLAGGTHDIVSLGVAPVGSIRAMKMTV